MKNVTLSIDDATWQHARIVAARRGTSVSALVRDYLVRLREQDARQTPGWEEFWREFDTAGAEVGDRPSRTHTYDR